MSDLQDKYAALDALAEAQAEIRRFQQALQDIAGSEAIPTAFEAWKWCKEVAIAALPPAERSDAEKTGASQS